MRLAWRIVRAVRVLVVLIVDVPVRVFHRLMMVFVLVALAQVQVKSQCHQRAGAQ